MDYAETLKLFFHVGDLDLEKRYTSCRGEEEEDAQMWPCGKAVKSRSHIVENAKYTS